MYRTSMLYAAYKKYISRSSEECCWQWAMLIHCLFHYIFQHEISYYYSDCWQTWPHAPALSTAPSRAVLCPRHVYYHSISGLKLGRVLRAFDSCRRLLSLSLTTNTSQGLLSVAVQLRQENCNSCSAADVEDITFDSALTLDEYLNMAPGEMRYFNSGPLKVSKRVGWCAEEDRAGGHPQVFQ